MKENGHGNDRAAEALMIPVISPVQAEAEIRAHETILLYFTAAGCNVCQAVKPRVTAMAQQYGVPMLLASIDDNTEFSAQRLVFTIPTVILIYQGREMARESRFIDFAQLEKTLSLCV